MIEDLLIVAAGMGTRLKAKGDLKPLVDLCGKPLIEHALEAAFTSGIKQAAVVVGYNASVLSDFLNQLALVRGWPISLIENPDYMLANGLSVLKAKGHFSGPFCLAMCDHFVDPSVYRKLMATSLNPHEVALAVDHRLDNPYVDLDDVTKVRVSGNKILSIGKDLNVFNGYDTGVFAAGPALFDAIAAYSKQEGDFSISGGMAFLARGGNAVAVDVGGSFWIDVDSPAMHTLAEEWLFANRSGAAGSPAGRGGSAQVGGREPG